MKVNIFKTMINPTLINYAVHIRPGFFVIYLYSNYVYP